MTHDVGTSWLNAHSTTYRCLRRPPRSACRLYDVEDVDRRLLAVGITRPPLKFRPPSSDLSGHDRPDHHHPRRLPLRLAALVTLPQIESPASASDAPGTLSPHHAT